MEADNFSKYKIKDHYEDVQNYSAGEFGFVKIGKSKQTGEVHCIKVIKKSKFKPEKLTKKIETLKTLESFKNENIAKIYGVAETAKKIYVMSEYLKGQELQKKVLKEGSLATDLSLDIAKQIANALIYYLENNSIFTDLRCEKIVFMDDINDEVKIIDNGSSRKFEGSFTAEEVKGFKPSDLLYMAPEILEDRFEEDSLSWSIGVILYFMLSGKLPFDGPSDPRIGKEEELFGERCWEDISEGVVAVLKDMLRPDVSKRIKVRSLEEVLGGLMRQLE